MTVAEHLKSRHLNQALHRVWVSEELQCATFPMWNLSGKLLGYQRYRPNGSKKLNKDPREGKYFTKLLTNAEYALWGMESWSLSNTLFVTEGLFDAARLTDRGYSAVATLSNNVSSTLHSWLWCVSKFRNVVAVCDNDAAGLSLAKCAPSHVVVEGAKDLGDASDLYVSNLLKAYS